MKPEGAIISGDRRQLAAPKTLPLKERGRGNGSSVFAITQPQAEPLSTQRPIVTQNEDMFISRVNRPNDAYIKSCYDRIVELEKTGQTRSQVEDGIETVLKEMAATALREGSSYANMVDSLLMLHWTRDMANDSAYNVHMKEHVEAIKVLVQAWIKEKSFPPGKIKILDASCGTGTGLEAFLEALPIDVLKRVRIVANDVSSASLEHASKRLKAFYEKRGIGELFENKVRFTQYDLTQDLPRGRFDFVLFSQTLGLICDDNALKAQRLGHSLPSEKRHFTAKKHLLDRLASKVKPYRGELLVIDENPMRLSRTPDVFDGIVEDVLFKEIFRPVDLHTLINDILKKITSLRFRGHVETFIDRHHSMYLISSKVERTIEKVHYTEDLANRDRIVADIRKMHPDLVARLQGFEHASGKTTFVPVQKGMPEYKELIIDKKFYYDNIAGKPAFWHRNGNNNLVVLSGLMHELGVDEMKYLVKLLKSSRKAQPGAALVFIDHFPAPTRSPYPVGNGDARTLVMNDFDDHVFCGGIRHGNEYGYWYEIINL